MVSMAAIPLLMPQGFLPFTPSLFVMFCKCPRLKHAGRRLYVVEQVTLNH
jgi:hypothetical protein